MELHSLIAALVLLTLKLLVNVQESHGFHLADYDDRASSSSLGEPVFRLEPPNVVNFANTQGATILCLVSGSPRPTITWYTSVTSSLDGIQGELSQLKQSRPVSNVTNLRYISHNGAALRLLPFKEADFRQDIHSTEYRCVASNHLATIHSRSVLVQVAMGSESANEVKVSDEFVALNSVAVFKCRANGAPEFSQLAEWFTSDGHRIEPGESSKGNKFTAFKSGELHVNQVEMSDLRRTYGCRVRNTITNQLSSSSGLAQLIVTTDHAPQLAPQVVHTVSQLISDDSIYQLRQRQQQERRTAGWLQGGARSLAPGVGSGVGIISGTSGGQRAAQIEQRLLLPCAIRYLRDDQQMQVQWLYQPANRPSQMATPLDQWAAARSLAFVQLLQATHNHNGSSPSPGPIQGQAQTSPQRIHHAAAVTRNTRLGSSQQQLPGHQQAPSTRFVQGPNYLAIEWPTRAQSGRYICQLWTPGAAGEPETTRSVCDISVIVRRPLKLRVSRRSSSIRDRRGSKRDQKEAAPLRMHQQASSNWLSRAADWLVTGWRQQESSLQASSKRRRRSQSGAAELDLEPEDDETRDDGQLDEWIHDGLSWRKIRVRGPGVVEMPHMVRVGQRLHLECRGSGYPIESVRWFRNGQPVNAQTSADFQVEMATGASDNDDDDDDLNHERLLSTLLVRQVQPKDIGLNVFECFAHNSLGERARAGLAVLLVERAQLDWARSVCPLQQQQQVNSSSPATAASAEQEDSSGEQHEFGSSVSLIFRRHNPLQRALLLEGEPAELTCPDWRGARRTGGQVEATDGGARIEWRRWSSSATDTLSATAAAAAAASVATGASGSNSNEDDELASRQQMTESQARNFNQLFSGDLRFVINGSSLQIRAPSKRYDEALYACRLRHALGTTGSAPILQEQAPAGNLQYQFGAGSLQEQQVVDQSSSASSSMCSALMESTLFRQLANGQSNASASSALPVSSISIRIVAKPKIDPFEFSRNLESGMRAVVVCAVVSGQSPVDITWFKDGDLLLADEQLTVDQANGFSSTLTFHRIRPSHSGLYTCVAANAFATTNHTSQLLVNVAPYFIDPPKSARAILGSNVLINCRSGGQPSPQIRWRKLVPVGPAPSRQIAATSGILGGGNDFDLAQMIPSAMQQSSAAPTPTTTATRHSEFRIVTSNSHIQVLENGSMIIKEVELNDASRYVCQAFNGIAPSLSEMIELLVLSPAQFEVNYETLTVKRQLIDPFEFSRNLESGMRAVVVCAVVSGQSPVDITWFKDGDLLLADEQLTVDQANGFSSTLTFHRIRPSHSGLYTCVAANAFATTNHTSQLLVNVAPYFIDPPKSARAILGSNVLINCRSGGQPSPQIRWRKLVPVGPAPSRQIAATSGILGGGNDFDLAQMIPSAMQQSSAAPTPTTTATRHSEFRIVTSNSHIQVLENGSMIIKEVELNDASRYVCQAFNGIAPSLSEMIELLVLSPAQFEVNYETLTVKRDSSLKFNCAPKGDQPLQIEWRKEDSPLAPVGANGTGLSAAERSSSKYMEVTTYLAAANNNGTARKRHSSLVLQPASILPQAAAVQPDRERDGGVLMSELHISYADRSDTGTFVCAASNAYGKDELVYRLVVQEPPDPPADVQLRGGTQPNQLKLLWTAPFDGNLPLSQFIVEYRRVASAAVSQPLANSAGGGEWSRLVVSVGGSAAKLPDQLLAFEGLTAELVAGQSAPNSTAATKGQQYSVQLRQLQARSLYQARVAAVNAMGQSAYSQVAGAQTAEEPPNGRPDDLRAEPVASSALKVSWRGPQLVEEQAPIKGYYVSHRKVASVQQSVAPGKELWLATSTINANNKSGQTLIQETLVPVSSQSNRRPQQQFGPGSQAIMNGPSYELVIGDLEKNTKYEVRVQPYNSMGVGPSSETVGQTLKFDRPAQPSIKLVAARRRSLELKWFISEDQPLLGFSLFYKCEYDDWQEIQLGLIYHYVIENLRCGNKYQIYLSAFNQVGRSDPSDVLNVRTEGTAPVAPDKSQFFRANITEIVLDMRGWKSGGCPISSFMIQFKRMHDTNWFILSEGQTPFAVSDKITIPDLVPATWYKLLVTALNEAGSTNAEYLFSTLTTSGEQIAPTFPLDELEESNGSWPQSAGKPAGGGSRSMLSGLSQLLFSATAGRNNQDGQLLLPFGCIFLLLLTTLASYLYYSRSGNSSASSNNSSASSSSRHKPQPQQVNGSPSLLMGQLAMMHGNGGNAGSLGCSTFASSAVRSIDEKQVIIEAPNGHQVHQHHMLADSSPYRSTPPSSDELNQPLQQANNSVIDTIVANSGLLNSFWSGTGPRQTRTSHGMRLLSSGNLFTGPNQNNNGQSNGSCPTSSSLSTYSTACNLDGSSIQGSSSGASSAGKTTKLQLIDESSLISDAIHETPEQHQQQQFIYGQNMVANNNLSPAHHQLFNQGQCSGHVDVILNNHYGQQSSEQASNEQHLIDANNFVNLMASQTAGTGQLYASSNHQRLSNSFASGADLMERQQHQQHHQVSVDEPIYQRLESFQACGLPTSRQQQQGCFARAKSQTLRFNHTNFGTFEDGDCSAKASQTLRRLGAGTHLSQFDSNGQPLGMEADINSLLNQKPFQNPEPMIGYTSEVHPTLSETSETISGQHVAFGQNNIHLSNQNQDC